MSTEMHVAWDGYPGHCGSEHEKSKWVSSQTTNSPAFNRQTPAMTSRLSSRRTRSLQIVLLGAFLVIFGFTTYPVIGLLNLNGGIGSEDFVLSYAYLALAVDMFGLCLMFYGGTNILTNRSLAESSGNPLSPSGIVAAAFVKSRYSRLLLASAFVYAIFYAFASGIVVFQPALSFSEAYHVGIPSMAIATCCGPVGQTPQVVVYLSQHLGLLIVPINLLLLSSISWLVGFNASFAIFTLSFRTKNASLGWFGGLGAFIGLFTSCPTCAGLALISLLGGTGALSASFFLGPLQTVLILVSIPVLVATPFVSARSLRSLDTCVLS